MGPLSSAIVASSIANAFGTVIGHPLDTIRVSKGTPDKVHFCILQAKFQQNIA